jgi:hypothetical protein
MQVVEERPPYVQFERRAVENRAATLSTGVYAKVDVDFALITPAGTRDQIERQVSEWFPQLRQSVAEERFRQDWLDLYIGAYEAWKKNQEIPLDGTPIKTWNALSPAQQANLLSVNIRTVEDLAAATEEALQFLGMGARDLKLRAQAYLAASKDPGKLAAQLSELTAKVDTLTSALAAKDRELEALRAKAK